MFKLEICVGTTCHIMGGGGLAELAERLPEELQGKVEVVGVLCLDRCKQNDAFGKAPFVRIDGQIVGVSSLEDLIERLTEKVRA